MLSLSIGWGIRGNYGHEYGAMIPGMLGAVAVCLVSGREDWNSRVPFFALFGALGWAFGGSMAYMPTVSYTHSGHLPTQLYGFFAVFSIGFLWTAMGGAGTAYAAVESREKLTAVIKPLCCILVFWAARDLWPSAPGDFRQRDPFYWLDSEWVEASLALAALAAFELWDRRFEKVGLLALFSGAGALAGFLAQRMLATTGWLRLILSFLVRLQGDPAVFNPSDLITNWPQVFTDIGGHMGWIIGLVVGAGVFFYRYGKWRSGSSLLLHITLGSYIVFLIGPVLLGLRMVPPRGDSWANTLGALLGALLYMRRNRLLPVAQAALVSGVIGGLGFMVAQFLKLLAWMPGNPLLTSDPATIDAWAHWRRANWHSILAEQGAGLFYGLAIVLTMAMLVNRAESTREARTRRWTEAFAVSFILNLLLYVNLVKNVADWTQERAGGFRSVPAVMKAPLFGGIEMSALGWFNLLFAAYTACTIALLVAHLRKPIAVVPASWLGKGQLFSLVFLWAVTIGNFGKALVAFREQRLATEAAITINALIATFLILYFARGLPGVPQVSAPEARWFGRIVPAGFAAMILDRAIHLRSSRCLRRPARRLWRSQSAFRPGSRLASPPDSEERAAPLNQRACLRPAARR
jgi:hypothetical protein